MGRTECLSGKPAQGNDKEVALAHCKRKNGTETRNPRKIDNHDANL